MRTSCARAARGVGHHEPAAVRASTTTLTIESARARRWPRQLASLPGEALGNGGAGRPEARAVVGTSTYASRRPWRPTDVRTWVCREGVGARALANGLKTIAWCSQCRRRRRDRDLLADDRPLVVGPGIRGLGHGLVDERADRARARSSTTRVAGEVVDEQAMRSQRPRSLGRQARASGMDARPRRMSSGVPADDGERVRSSCPASDTNAEPVLGVGAGLQRRLDVVEHGVDGGEADLAGPRWWGSAPARGGDERRRRARAAGSRPRPQSRRPPAAGAGPAYEPGADDADEEQRQAHGDDLDDDQAPASGRRRQRTEPAATTVIGWPFGLNAGTATARLLPGRSTDTEDGSAFCARSGRQLRGVGVVQQLGVGRPG